MVDKLKWKLLLLAIIGFIIIGNTACKDVDNTVKGTGTSHSQIWECIPELHPEIKITLTFDAAGKVVSNTYPQDIQQIIAPYMYTLLDNIHFIVTENKMCIDHNFYNEFQPCESGYYITKLSNDTMRLEYFGGYWTYDKVVGVFLFARGGNDE